MFCRPLLTAVILAGLAAVAAGQAPRLSPTGDWPQWRGPDRTGLSRETGLLRAWPAGGPRLVWSVNTLQAGVGSVAIAGDHIFAQGSDVNITRLMSLARTDGKREWITDLGPSFRVGSAGLGPRATPTVDGDRVYAMTEAGDLACVRVRDGAVLWRRNVLEDFAAPRPTYLVSESPLVDGRRLYVSPGGPNAGIVALDKMTGKTIWKSKELGEGAGYGSLIVADIHGVRTLLAMTAAGGAGVRASDGTIMWKDARISVSGGNISTPTLFDNNALYAYDSGLSMLGLTRGRGSVIAKPVYFSTDLRVLTGGVLLVNGYLYAFNDWGLQCLEAATGKRVWRDRSVGTGAMTYADGHLYLLSRDFIVGLAEATPDGYREKGRFTIAETETPSYAHPVVSGGRLYIRNQGTLAAYDIKAK